MSQDAYPVLAAIAREAEVAFMRTPKDQCQMAVIVLLVVVTCGSLALIAAGVNVTAMKEVLTIVFPPIVALAAAGVGKK